MQPLAGTYQGIGPEAGSDHTGAPASGIRHDLGLVIRWGGAGKLISIRVELPLQSSRGNITVSNQCHAVGIQAGRSQEGK